MNGSRRRRWRPSLGQVVFVVLSTVLALPLVGLFFFRLYENQLIRETQAELIAQSAAISAIFATKIEALPAEQRVLGAKAIKAEEIDNGSYTPIPATLDLTTGPILNTRPAAAPATETPSAQYIAIGEALNDVIRRTQTITLAGFRLLDARGVVITGREEIGQSLAHVEEVSSALAGSFSSVLRVRAVNRPAPPLYSLSRGTSVRIFIAMPVVVEGRVAGVVYASRTPDNILKHIYAERKKYILAAFTVLLVTLAIGLIFVRLISRPIYDLLRRAKEIGNKVEHPAPIKHFGTREVMLLSEGLDNMARSLRERSDYIANFAAHVSHEIKTPLTSIQGAAELLRDAPDMAEQDRRRFLDNVIADTGRLTKILHRLRELARADNPQTHGETNLRSLIADLKIAFPALNLTAEENYEGLIPMSHENAMIVFTHLADNAQRHGAHHISLALMEQDAHIKITFSDDGEGISERNRERIFDPFFTTRRESGGTGMGLGIVRSMLIAHGGTVELDHSQVGTTFALILPKAKNA